MADRIGYEDGTVYSSVNVVTAAKDLDQRIGTSISRPKLLYYSQRIVSSPICHHESNLLPNRLSVIGQGPGRLKGSGQDPANTVCG
jgi:hypothetical protein